MLALVKLTTLTPDTVVKVTKSPATAPFADPVDTETVVEFAVKVKFAAIVVDRGVMS
jgi:hypothetical protein